LGSGSLARRLTGSRSTTVRAQTFPQRRKASQKSPSYVELTKAAGRCRSYPRVHLCSDLPNRSTGNDPGSPRGSRTRPGRARLGPPPGETIPGRRQRESPQCIRQRRAKSPCVGVLFPPGCGFVATEISQCPSLKDSRVRCAATASRDSSRYRTVLRMIEFTIGVGFLGNDRNVDKVLLQGR
jgi:hypothetical protein